MPTLFPQEGGVVKRSLIWLLHISALTALSITAACSGLWLYMKPLSPAADALQNYSLEIPLRVYSADTKLIGEFGEKRRIPIRYKDVPQDLINSILVAEDDRFHSHAGVDIAGILRAFSELILSGSIQSGGSTITMQVARNYLLTLDRTLVRKIKEILLALRIEQQLGKEEILELYVNKIFLGKRAYGAAAAAQIYYGKPLSELNLAQYAMIAGLPKAPSAYNPIANPERALERRNWILQRLFNLGYVNEERYNEAKAQGVSAKRHATPIEVDALHAAEWARQIVIDGLYGIGAYSRGYKVYTTIRSDWQTAAQRSVSKGMFDYDWRHGWRGVLNRINIDDIDLTVDIAGEILSYSAREGDFPDIEMEYSSDDNAATISIGANAYSIPLPSKKNDYANAPSAGVLLSEESMTEWQRQLVALENYPNLVPAAVTAVRWREIDVLLADNSTHTLPWKHGLDTARRYLSENYVGKAPVSSFDLVGVGDVVYLRKYKEEYHLRQVPDIRSALVAVDPNNGAVRSLVSGFDFHSDKFNNVVQSMRQPGSGIKPFIYARALEKGYTAASLFNDAPLSFDDDLLEDVWRPSNASDIFRGPTRMRVGLYRSVNLVSIRILRAIGVASGISSLRRFGFNMKGVSPDLSLVLGSQVVRPIDIARAYSVFANGGYLVDPYIIERVENAEGETIYQASPKRLPDNECPLDTPEQCEEYRVLIHGLQPGGGDDNVAPRVIDERVRFIMDDMLRDVIRRGTARAALKLGRNDVAGKTGTTNGPTDAWFSGYHSDLVTTVWFGFGDNKNMGEREYGGSMAVPVWVDFMHVALKGKPEQIAKQPDGLSVVRIDPVTGELALSSQTNDDLEIFRSESVPKRTWAGVSEKALEATINGDSSDYPAGSSVDELF